MTQIAYKCIHDSQISVAYTSYILNHTSEYRVHCIQGWAERYDHFMKDHKVGI